MHRAPRAVGRRGGPRRRKAAGRFAGRGGSGDRRRAAVRRVPPHPGRPRSAHGTERGLGRAAGLHPPRAHRRRGGLQRLQSPPEPDRPPGRPGGGGRLPGDRQAGQGGPAVVLAVRRHPPRGRAAGGVVPGPLDRRRGPQPPAGRRPAGGVLQFHRQRARGLDVAVAVGPRHALLAGARRRGPGGGGRRRRFRRDGAAVGQGRLLSCRPGLRLRAAGLRRAANRREAGRRHCPAGRRP